MGPRQIKICFVNSQPQVHDSAHAMFQIRLKHLFEIDWAMSDSIGKAPIESSDLLILQARHVDETDLRPWLEKQRAHLAGRVSIMTPTLIFKDMAFAELADLYVQTAENNWYIDIMSAAEIDSLPIRIANLLRIYDHMRELDRYASSVKSLQERVNELEMELLKLKKQSHESRKPD